MESRIAGHALEEQNAQTELDLEFMRKCSEGKEIWNVARDKVADVIRCGSKIYDDTIIEHVRHEELAKELTQYLIDQSALYKQKKISKSTYKNDVSALGTPKMKSEQSAPTGKRSKPPQGMSNFPTLLQEQSL